MELFKLGKILLGYVTVDSGQLLIIDPCYLSEWKHGEFAPDDDNEYNSYNAACELTLSDKRFGNVLGGIVFSSGYGDGNYPVYCNTDNDGVIIKVEILMS